jgi:hypothetical protein
MFPSADYFRLDWRSELKKLQIYLEGKSGVVRIDFASDDAAADKFNYILKEDFGKIGNGSWLSLRIDWDWSTTYTVDDQINAFAKKLGEAGVVLEWPNSGLSGGDLFSDNSSEGDMNLTMTGNTVFNGFDTSAYAIQERVSAVCDAMRRYVADGGKFMVIVNDMSKANQGRFWRTFWNAGLREAGGDGLSLIYYVGSLCGDEPHEDAPAPDLQIALPSSIEGDETRENDVYDDILGSGLITSS